MSNIFEGMNRKSRRGFNKLHDEQKQEVIRSAIMDKVSGVMAGEVAKSIITGMQLAHEQLYTKYVSAIDELQVNGEDSSQEIEKLLGHIRTEYLKIMTEKRKESEKENGE